MDIGDAAGQRPAGYPGEPGIADHLREEVRRRELADRLHEIAVGFAIAGDHFAERRNDVEGIGVVDAVEHGRFHRGEFQHEKTPATLEHAERLAQRERDAGHIADAESDRVAVIGAIFKGQRLGIAFDEADLPVEPPRAGPILADAEHGCIDINHVDLRLGAAGLDNAEGDIARPAGNIDMAERPLPGRTEHGDKNVLPEPVQAHAHQVVHQVIARGHLVKDTIHPGLLVRQRNILEPEMRCLDHHKPAQHKAGRVPASFP